MTSLICGFLLNDATNEPIYKTETSSQTENRFVMNQVGGGKMEWEFEVSSCNLLYTEWINNKVLLYGTGNYIQYPVVNHNGKIYKKNAYICITESLCCAAETNTHYKLTICQLKIIINGTLILHSQQYFGHPDREFISKKRI